MPLFRNLSTDPEKRPRLLGEIGALTHTELRTGETKYDSGNEIFGEAEPANYLYQVVEGAVRTHKLLSDGRRQIGAFHMPGDIFGFENGHVHRFTAEAIVDTTVRFVNRESFERVEETDFAMFKSLLNMTTDSLQHAEDHMLLLGRKNALERVAAFLLEMHRRQIPEGFVALPMGRRDIADYLGLTLETVSRILSELCRTGYLSMMGETRRTIVVLNPVGLAELER